MFDYEEKLTLYIVKLTRKIVKLTIYMVDYPERGDKNVRDMQMLNKPSALLWSMVFNCFVLDEVQH